MTKRQAWYLIWSMYRKARCEMPSPLRTPAWALEALKRAEARDNASRWYENRILRRQVQKRQPFAWHPLSQLNCRCVVRPITTAEQMVAMGLPLAVALAEKQIKKKD